MTQAKPRFSTFEEYLSYDDGTDKLYELFSRELIELPPESGQNSRILSFLHLHLALLVGHLRVRWGLELEVRGEPKNRYPDLTVIREEHIQQLEPRNTIRLSMPPPYWSLKRSVLETAIEKGITLINAFSIKIGASLNTG